MADCIFISGKTCWTTPPTTDDGYAKCCACLIAQLVGGANPSKIVNKLTLKSTAGPQ